MSMVVTMRSGWRHRTATSIPSAVLKGCLSLSLPLWGRAGRGSTVEAAKIPSAGVGEDPGGFARQDGPFEKDPLPDPPPQGEGPKSTALPLGGREILFF